MRNSSQHLISQPSSLISHLFFQHNKSHLPASFTVIPTIGEELFPLAANTHIRNLYRVARYSGRDQQFAVGCRQIETPFPFSGWDGKRIPGETVLDKRL